MGKVRIPEVSTVEDVLDLRIGKLLNRNLLRLMNEKRNNLAAWQTFTRGLLDAVFEAVPISDPSRRQAIEQRLVQELSKKPDHGEMEE